MELKVDTQERDRGQIWSRKRHWEKEQHSFYSNRESSMSRERRERQGAHHENIKYSINGRSIKSSGSMSALTMPPRSFFF